MHFPYGNIIRIFNGEGSFGFKRKLGVGLNFSFTFSDSSDLLMSFMEGVSMKTLVLAILIGLLIPTAGWAGKINGTLRKNGKILPNQKVLIQCGDKKYPGSTNRRGAFKVFVDRRGKCTFTVPGLSKAGQVISSYKDPVRYDFKIDNKGNLSRK